MDAETIKTKIAFYKQQRQEALQRRIELDRAAEQEGQRAIALGGAIEALEDLLRSEQPVAEAQP